MLGIILTLIAVLLVICFAFHYPVRERAKAEAFFYIPPKGAKRNPKSAA